MEVEALLENTVIEPDDLIGTRWNGWGESFCDRMAIEFVDKTNCIYTSKPKQYPMTYTVTGGKVYISSLEDPFELKGNVLFNCDMPTFKKA